MFQARATARQRPLALWLTAMAGAVDAVGYVLLAHIFVANMSGNTVALGMYSAQGQGGEALHRGFPILMFILGLLLGGTVAEVQRRRGVRKAVAWALMVEAVLLGGFLGIGVGTEGWHARTTGGPPLLQGVLIALPALAMGVQNVTLRASGALSAYTTHVTGSLTQMAEEIVCFGIWLWHWARERSTARPGRWRRIIRGSGRHPSMWKALFLLAAWISYVVGAFAIVVLFERWGMVVIGFPLAGVAAAAVWELLHRNPAN